LKRWAGNLAILAGTGVIAVLLLEGALRALGFPPSILPRSSRLWNVLSSGTSNAATNESPRKSTRVVPGGFAGA